MVLGSYYTAPDPGPGPPWDVLPGLLRRGPRSVLCGSRYCLPSLHTGRSLYGQAHYLVSHTSPLICPPALYQTPGSVLGTAGSGLNMTLRKCIFNRVASKKKRIKMTVSSAGTQEGVGWVSGRPQGMYVCGGGGHLGSDWNDRALSSVHLLLNNS